MHSHARTFYLHTFIFDGKHRGFYTDPSFFRGKFYLPGKVRLMHFVELSVPVDVYGIYPPDRL